MPPKPLLLGLVTNRWRTFGRGTDRIELVSREVEIVRAGFAGHIDPLFAGTNNLLDRLEAGAVADVDAASRHLGKEDGTAHRLHLSEDWTGFHELLERVGACCDCPLPQGIGDRSILAVYAQHLASLRNLPHALVEGVVVDILEVTLDATVATGGKEALVSADAALIKLLDATAEVEGNQASERSVVHAELILAGVILGLKR